MPQSWGRSPVIPRSSRSGGACRERGDAVEGRDATLATARVANADLAAVGPCCVCAGCGPRERGHGCALPRGDFGTLCRNPRHARPLSLNGRDLVAAARSTVSGTRWGKGGRTCHSCHSNEISSWAATGLVRAERGGTFGLSLRDRSIVGTRRQLLRENRSVGEDLLAIGRWCRVEWYLVPAWAPPYDRAAGRSDGRCFAAPGRFILGILRLRYIAKIGGIYDRPGVEGR